MVTPVTGTDDIRSYINNDRWDLIDRSKRDPWLLKTYSLLKKDPEVWVALNNGPQNRP